MNGFVNIKVVKKEAVPVNILQSWIQHGVWNISDVALQNTLANTLLGKVFLLSLTCQKPNYVVGSGAKLSFGKKKNGKCLVWL